MKRTLSFCVTVCILLLCATQISAASDDTIDTLFVGDFQSLEAISEDFRNVRLILTKDITATEDLRFISSEARKREIILDLNGYSLSFESEKCLFINDWSGYSTRTDMCFTLTSGKKGASVIFLYIPEKGFPGGFCNAGNLTLDGDVSLTAENAVTGSSLTPIGQSVGGSLIVNADPDSFLVVNSGNLNGLGNFQKVIENNGGRLTINGGIIQNGTNVAITSNDNCIFNDGGELLINGGRIQAYGEGCTAIINYDSFNPCGTPALVGESSPLPVKDTFVMTGGSVTAEGKDATAVDLGINGMVIGGRIAASGENSVGIRYAHATEPEEAQNITLLGGRIAGEGRALADKSGNSAWYKNIDGGAVPVGSAEKEITPGPGDISPDSWYAPVFYQLVYDGTIKGYPGGSFRPHGGITRSELVALLAHMDGEDMSRYEAVEPPFKDVAVPVWYAASTLWGKAKGIVSGYPDGSFRAGDRVTREQLVTMAYEYALHKGVEMKPGTTQSGNIDGFTDAARVSEWATPAMQWAIDAGIVSGRGNNRLAPKETATRAEAAVLLAKAIASMD